MDFDGALALEELEVLVGDVAGDERTLRSPRIAHRGLATRLDGDDLACALGFIVFGVMILRVGTMPMRSRPRRFICKTP